MPLPAYMYDKDGDGTITILDAHAMLNDDNENDLGWTGDSGEGMAWLNRQQTYLDTLDQNTNPFESTPPPKDRNSLVDLMVNEYGISQSDAEEWSSLMDPYDPMQEAFRQEDLAFSMQDLAQDQRGSILEGLAAGEQSAFAGRGLQSGIAQRQTERAISESQKQYERGAAKERFGFQEDIFDLRDEWDITDEFEKLNASGVISDEKYQALLKSAQFEEAGYDPSSVAGLNDDAIQGLQTGNDEDVPPHIQAQYGDQNRTDFWQGIGQQSGGGIDITAHKQGDLFKEGGSPAGGSIARGGGHRYGSKGEGYPQPQGVIEPNWKSFPGEVVSFTATSFNPRIKKSGTSRKSMEAAEGRDRNYSQYNYEFRGTEGGNWQKLSPTV